MGWVGLEMISEGTATPPTRTYSRFSSITRELLRDLLIHLFVNSICGWQNIWCKPTRVANAKKYLKSYFASFDHPLSLRKGITTKLLILKFLGAGISPNRHITTSQQKHKNIPKLAILNTTTHDAKHVLHAARETHYFGPLNLSLHFGTPGGHTTVTTSTRLPTGPRRNTSASKNK